MNFNNIRIKKKISTRYNNFSDFADKLGIDPGRLSRILNGQAKFKIRKDEVNSWKKLLECKEGFLKPIIKEE